MNHSQNKDYLLIFISDSRHHFILFYFSPIFNNFFSFLLPNKSSNWDAACELVFDNSLPMLVNFHAF